MSCYPAIPEVPYIPPTLVWFDEPGWGTIAHSVEDAGLVTQDGFVFSVPTAVVGVVVGVMATASTPTTYAEFPVSLRFSRGVVELLYGFHVQQAFPATTFTTNDVFRIAGTHSHFEFYQNGRLIHTAQRSFGGLWRLVADLYMTGDSVEAAEYRSYIVTGEGTNQIGEMSVRGLEVFTSDGYAEIGEMVVLGRVATEIGSATLDLSAVGYWSANNGSATIGDLTNQTAHGSASIGQFEVVGNRSGRFGQATIGEMSTLSYGGLTTYTTGQGVAHLTGGSTTGHGVTGGVGGTYTSTIWGPLVEGYSPVRHTVTPNTLGFAALGADRPYGEGRADITRLVVLGLEAIRNASLIVISHSGDYSVSCAMTGHAPNGAYLTGESGAVEMFTGMSSMMLGEYTALTAEGTVQSTMRAELVGEYCALVATGSVGGTMVADMDHGGGYSVSVFAGGYADLDTLTGYMSAGGSVGGVLTAHLTTDGMYEVLCTGSADATMSVDIAAEPVQTVASMQALLTAAYYTVQIEGSPLVSVTYEAYAINLTTGAVTHYTNYPFDNILRFGNHYYGVKSDGVYELGGTLDVGVQIDAHIKTFQTPFGTKNQKRVPYVYASGRSDQGVVVGVTADEGTTYEYESAWGEVAGTANHRVKVGNGIRGVYYSLDVKNVDGGSLELDEISVHVAPTTRAV